MKKIMICFFSIVFAVVLFAIAGLLLSCNSNIDSNINIYKSQESIRKQWLNLTPIDSSIEDAINAIKNQGAKNYIQYEQDYTGKWIMFGADSGYVINNGYIIDNQGRPTTDFNPNTTKEIIGEKSVITEARYNSGCSGHWTIKVCWGFDENSKLIDIAVSKYSVAMFS